MKVRWQTEWPHWLLLAGMFALAALTWPTAPDRIAMHWNLAGKVDGYGGRFEGLFAVPLITLGIYLLFLALPLLDPGRMNYPRFHSAYQVIRLSLLVFLAMVYGIMHMWMRGHHIAIERVMPIILGGFLIVYGNLLGKIRPNWFIGIRTPWTLSSKLAWSKTNRYGGWGLVVIGIILIGVSALAPQWTSPTAITVLVGGLLWALAYSFWVWRNDPHKVPPAGSQPANDS